MRASELDDAAAASAPVPAFFTSPRRNASMNARASSSDSLSSSMLTSCSSSSFPVRSALRSALGALVLGRTDVPSEVDGVVDGTCVREDLNFDWMGLGGGLASVASSGTSCDVHFFFR